MNKIKNVKLGSAVGLLATLSSAAIAQEQSPGGTIMTLGVSQRLSYSDNHNFSAAENDAFTSTTGLAFALTSETKTEMVTFNAGGGLGYDSITDEFGLTDPNISFGYKQDSKNAGIEATLGYRESDVSSFVDVQAGTDSFLVIDEGTRTDLGGRLTYDFGRTDPISGFVSLTYNKTDYIGTSSTELVPQETIGVSGQVNFRVDDRITTNVSGGLSKRSTESGVDTTNKNIGAGVTLAYSKRLDLDASLRFSQVEQTTSGVTARSEGLGFSTSASYEMPDGEITASFSSSVDEYGRRYTTRIGRSMQLKTARLNYSFGLSGRDTGNLSPLYALSYNQELPRDATASVQLTQSFATNDSGRDAINTSLSAAYQMPLTPLSMIGVSLNYRGTAVTNFDNEDVSRTDFSVNYTHALAEDWGITTGFTSSIATDDGAADIRSNEVFIGLQKDFSWRP